MVSLVSTGPEASPGLEEHGSGAASVDVRKLYIFPDQLHSRSSASSKEYVDLVVGSPKQPDFLDAAYRAAAAAIKQCAGRFSGLA